VTANVSRNGANAIMIEGTPEAMTNRALIANLIGAARLPAIYTIPEFADAGHLMAYSLDVAELNKGAANNIGCHPSPFHQNSKVEFSVKLKIAKALGIDVPATLLASPDNVIE
jgi:putative ABC transport system substrate-binding protein